MAYEMGTARLKMLGLPVILSTDDFMVMTHVSKYTIYQLSKNSEKYYKTFEIPKKNGQPRLIAQPSKKLKALQAWILHNILNRLEVSDACKGFTKGSSIVQNVEPHVGAAIVINLDLKDFFPSVPARRVFRIFRLIGYSQSISTILTKICVFQNGLPQGGPCSPKLANLVAWNLDSRIQGYVGKRGITFTRYADDLSFSGLNPNKVCRIIPTVTKIIESEGFMVNERKTRVTGPSRQKKITGLVVNEDSFGIGHKQYRLLRAKIHRLSHPEEAHNEDLFLHVKGWLAYLRSVDPNRNKKALNYVKDLIGKDTESQLRRLLPKKREHITSSQ